MSEKFKAACSRVFSNDFSNEDAHEILLHEFGTRECMFATANSAMSVGTIKAIEQLGGKYHNSWGITVMPVWFPE